MRPFRFGVQLSSGSLDQLIGDARVAEQAGFDAVQLGDHVGDGWPPLIALAGIATATSRIELCPLVLNNDFRHPVQLARDVAALDHLSNGRVMLGIGAGHSAPEYDAVGVPFDPPAVRKARLAEAVEILRELFDRGEVSYAGAHYRLDGAAVGRPVQEHLPILVGVNGRTALAHAAAHADVVGLTMLGRTLPDGQRHETRWEADRLDATVAFVRSEAARHGREVELHALVQAVVITEDREDAARGFVADGYAPTVKDALATPFLAVGTPAEIAEHLHACRERFGITYFTVRSLRRFAPVLERVRRTS